MQDYLYFSEQITNDEQLVQDTVRDFIDNDVKPLLLESYEHAKFPMELIPKISSLGLFGITLPTEYGCGGMSSLSYGLVCQELEAGDSGIRSFVSVQSSLCMYPIFKFGTEEQRRKYLKEMALGNILGCFGLTEPNSGSDPASMKTFAKKTEGGWILNGSKLWITNATIANIAIIWANTEDGIRGFIVPTDSKGFKATELKYKMSLRASITGEINLNNVFVSDDNYLPGSDIGLKAPLSCLTQARFGIAFGAIGAARSCYETALNYVKERKQFDKPIASKQLIQKDLVEMYSEICKAMYINLHVAKLKDENKLDHVMVSLIKRNSCKVALQIARDARNILGANGISLEYDVIRHMNNLESVFTYEGTDNIHTLTIGRALTGISAF